MAETLRTRASLLTLLADNVSGDISAQLLRDMLVSVFGVWSAIYVFEGVVEQIGITTTPEKLTGFDTNLAGVGAMTPDHTDDSIQINLDGDYLLLGQLFFSGDGNQGFIIDVAVDGVQAPFGTGRKLGVGGDEGSCSIIAPLPGLTSGEKLTFRIATDAGVADALPVIMIMFAIKIS